jgi:hypothetical protein
MLIQTTSFGTMIIAEAEKLLLSRCYELHNRNDGACINSLVSEFDSIVAGGMKKSGDRGKGDRQPGENVAYCAITQSVILKRACEKKGIVNPIASALPYGNKSLYALAKANGIRIDNVPAPGAIGIKPAPAAASKFHALLCWYIDEKGVVHTIEGNTSGYWVSTDNGCMAKPPHDGVVTNVRTPSQIKYYIHTEEMFGVDVATYQSNTIDVATGLSGLGRLSAEIDPNANEADLQSGDYCVTSMLLDNPVSEKSFITDWTPYYIAGGIVVALVGGYLLYKYYN